MQLNSDLVFSLRNLTLIQYKSKQVKIRFKVNPVMVNRKLLLKIVITRHLLSSSEDVEIYKLLQRVLIFKKLRECGKLTDSQMQ